jgi:hypothetical protein
MKPRAPQARRLGCGDLIRGAHNKATGTSKFAVGRISNPAVCDVAAGLEMRPTANFLVPIAQMRKSEECP